MRREHVWNISDESGTYQEHVRNIQKMHTSNTAKENTPKTSQPQEHDIRKRCQVCLTQLPATCAEHVRNMCRARLEHEWNTAHHVPYVRLSLTALLVPSFTAEHSSHIRLLAALLTCQHMTHAPHDPPHDSCASRTASVTSSMKSINSKDKQHDHPQMGRASGGALPFLSMRDIRVNSCRA